MAALALDVGLHTLLAAREDFSISRRRGRGRAVVKVLDTLVMDDQLLWRLLRCGFQLRVCGRAYRCDVSGVLQPVFRAEND